jgi:CelD/BcsL family acetyltransferase involved in cellulose biosynthesis
MYPSGQWRLLIHVAPLVKSEPPGCGRGAGGLPGRLPPPMRNQVSGPDLAHLSKRASETSARTDRGAETTTGRERPTTMESRIVCAREVGPKDEAAWRDLATRAIDPNPLFEADCVVPAAVHQSFGQEIDLVLAEEGGVFYGCMPVRQVKRWRRFPYPFVTTEVRRMIYCGTPLLDPQRSVEAMEAMLRALRKRKNLTTGRVLVLQEVAEGGPVEEVVLAATRRARVRALRHESWERPYLRRRDEPTYSASIHTKKDLKNMARLRRKLEAAAGGPVQLLDRSADPAAVDELVRLEDAGYKAQIGVAMSTAPGEIAYFKEMCDRFREAGRLHVYTLESDSTVCALVLLVEARDGLMMLKVGYEERFARSSPGLQLHLDLIEHFHHDTDARWLDVCTYPDNRTLLRMYPDRIRFTSFMVPMGRNPLDYLAVRAFMVLRPLHRRFYDSRATRKQRLGESPGNARGDGEARSEQASRETGQSQPTSADAPGPGVKGAPEPAPPREGDRRRVPAPSGR